MREIPNPTENKMFISRNDSIERILLSNAYISDDNLFSLLIGFPEGCDNYFTDYDVDKWVGFYGTPEDVEYDLVTFEIKESQIELQFISVLTPPVSFILRLIDKYDCDVELCYNNEDDNYSGCFKIFRNRNGIFQNLEYCNFHEVLAIEDLEEKLNLFRRKVKIDKIVSHIQPECDDEWINTNANKKSMFYYTLKSKDYSTKL